MSRPRIKAALVDLSGTIHIGDHPIPGAIEACKKLLKHGVAVKFLTNTSKQSSASLLSQLRNIGFDEHSVPNGSIMTSTGAARELLIRRKMRPLCLVEKDLIDDLRDVDMEDPNCVLVGLAPSAFNYSNLNDAFRLVMRLKKDGFQYRAPIIAIHRAKYFRDADNELSLGPGGFVSCLEEASGANVEVVGKPSRSFFEAALSDLDVASQDVVMIGDDATQDIAGALTAGIRLGILVRTGKYIEGDETKLPEGGIVMDSIVEAVDYVCGF